MPHLLFFNVQQSAKAEKKLGWAADFLQVVFKINDGTIMKVPHNITRVYLFKGSGRSYTIVAAVFIDLKYLFSKSNHRVKVRDCEMITRKQWRYRFTQNLAFRRVSVK